jgi:hypothetical protein
VQGISTAPEVFNEIMRLHEQEAAAASAAAPAAATGALDVSVDAGAPTTSPTGGSASKKALPGEVPLWKLQCVRAVGVAIVLQGSMHPAMELLLRHAIQYAVVQIFCRPFSFGPSRFDIQKRVCSPNGATTQSESQRHLHAQYSPEQVLRSEGL